MLTTLFEPSGELSVFQSQLNELVRTHQSVLVLVAEDSPLVNQAFEPLNALLTSLPIPILGGVFPAVLFNHQKHTRGTVFIGFKERLKVHRVDQLSDKTAAQIDAEIESQSVSFTEAVHTLFVFVDGLSKQVGPSTQALYENYGLNCNYVGGGAAFLSLETKPVIVSNQGILSDTLIYAFSCQASRLAIAHGWQFLRGPYEVTKVKHNTLIELDYRPALNVYEEAIGDFLPTALNENNFFNLAKAFPFGIQTLYDNVIVRDPIKLRGHSLQCAGDFREGSYVNILHGSKQNLIDAAAQVAEKMQCCSEQAELVFIMDCISRALFLEADWDQQMTPFKALKLPMVGALSVGEIANNGYYYLDFYNKSLIAVTLSRKPVACLSELEYNRPQNLPSEC